jgi:hypothetical protein
LIKASGYFTLSVSRRHANNYRQPAIVNRHDDQSVIPPCPLRAPRVRGQDDTPDCRDRFPAVTRRFGYNILLFIECRLSC